MPKIAIVESSAIFADALAYLANAVPGVQVVAIVPEEAARELAARTEIDLWIVEFGLKNAAVLDLLRNGTIPPSRTCALAFHLTPRLNATLVELGVHTILQKEDASELLEVIRLFSQTETMSSTADC